VKFTIFKLYGAIISALPLKTGKTPEPLNYEVVSNKDTDDESDQDE